MTSLENNADKVGLVCYAPLFANVDYVDWKPDMIWFDNHRVYGSANYYVQKLFMTATGTDLLETSGEGFGAPEIIGEDKIEGDIEILADRIDGKIYDISFTDLDTDKQTKIADMRLAPSDTGTVAKTAAKRYRLEFKLMRTQGEKGFRLFFGKTDEKNYIQWFIGGWQNQDTEISSVINGRSSTLDHNIFSLMTGREYKMRLEIDGRSIRTYIDGKEANCGIHRRASIEELYYTASRDDEKIYIKAVDVRETEICASVSVDEAESINAVVRTLRAPLDAENSLDEPEKVSPDEAELKSDTNSFEYTFPPRSVTVFEIKR